VTALPRNAFPTAVFPTDPAPLAVVVVRDGMLPLGAGEAVAEADGAALLIGSGTATAADALAPLRFGWLAEAGSFAPAGWSAVLAPLLRECGPIVLPDSPDGRDLAPRLAAAMDRPLLAGAVRVTATGAEVSRWNGRVSVELTVDGPFVATLQAGAGAAARPCEQKLVLEHQFLLTRDAVPLAVLPPDPATVDLAEAPRILCAGAGLGRGRLDGPDAVALLGRVAAALGASLGATRVVTDAGWAAHQRQIGTTGVMVAPDLYVAFGVSGAAQHTSGLGTPEHVVSVNVDPFCPMTAMAGLGIVADAADVLTELAALLEVAP